MPVVPAQLASFGNGSFQRIMLIGGLLLHLMMRTFLLSTTNSHLHREEAGLSEVHEWSGFEGLRGKQGQIPLLQVGKALYKSLFDVF